MAFEGHLYIVLLLLLAQQHNSTAQDKVAEPEILTHYDTSNQDQNETADDRLCLARNAVCTGRKLAERFHDDAVLSNDDFRRLLKDIEKGLQEYDTADFTKGCRESADAENGAVNCSQILTECSTIDEIYDRNSEKDGGLKYSRLAVALQEAAFSVTNPKCRFSNEGHKGVKPTTAQAWGYGIGFVTLVCIISNIGGLLTPFMTHAFFQRLLQFLVAMGAGTLVATGLLVLLPEAFDIASIEELSEDYVWKSATALFSIYVFFISERFFKFLLQTRVSKRQIKRRGDLSTRIHGSSVDDTDDTDETDAAPMTTTTTSTSAAAENGQQQSGGDHGHSHFVTPPSGGKGKRGPVATVAWMVLIGDVIHNFVDGMAIGAAFTENVYLGISIGIAVLCEELPHELGDVAILLHSGMSMKRALFLNFLSACVAYLGLVIGIVLGENTAANRWILAVAGGLFLYVPLVDMLPDMSQHLDMKMRQSNPAQGKQGRISREAWLILFCQSVGLLLGMCIILTVISLTGMVELGN